MSQDELSKSNSETTVTIATFSWEDFGVQGKRVAFRYSHIVLSVRKPISLKRQEISHWGSGGSSLKYFWGSGGYSLKYFIFAPCPHKGLEVIQIYVLRLRAVPVSALAAIIPISETDWVFTVICKTHPMKCAILGFGQW